MPAKKPSKPHKLLPVPLPTSLPASACTVHHDLSGIAFESTSDLEVLEAVIEQDRAVRSLELGLTVSRPNYHVYVAGPSGTGKRSQLRSMLKRVAPPRKTPSDWVYLHNFANTDAPIAVSLKAGDGKLFKKAMEIMLHELQRQMPAAYHSRDHQSRLQHTLALGNQHSTDAFVQLSRQAEMIGFVVRANKEDELITMPIVDGKSLNDKEVVALPEEERKKLDKKRERLEPLFTEFVQSNREVEMGTQAEIDKLQRKLAERVAKPLFREVRDAFRSAGKKLTQFLDALYDDVLENTERFLPDEGKPEEAQQPQQAPDTYIAFRVNLVVDHSETEGAPVVFESHPTYYRMFGKIERRVEQGIYFTDHMMIRAGSFAKANGGFLICHAADLFQFVGVWENLKVTLRNGEIAIEDMGETAGILPTSGLKPEPIPLSLKLVLIGGNSLYHALYRADDDFRKIFQIKADFDHEIRATSDSVRNYVRFIATAAQNNGCRPVERDAVIAVLEHGARLVDSQKKLTMRFNQVSNLLVEADWFANRGRAKHISRKHVERAIAQRAMASSLIADKMHEDLLDGQWLMESTGAEVGVINGLAVLTVGEHQFGRPFRVTARAFAGMEGIVNIEREVAMSGEIHDKGVQILSGFLGDRFAQKRPLCLTTTVTFEQNYGEVDGDSASSTWLYAILSAVSQVPIAQGIGVTGSVNQLGQVQPIGGVNEKIEGFYRFCASSKLTGRQGVLIPWQNVQHLVLHKDVRDAIAKKKFHVWPIRTIEEGMEILTGVQAGERQKDGTFPPGTVMRAVADRLDVLRAHAGERQSRTTNRGRKSVRRSLDSDDGEDGEMMDLND
jgi:lon-related putative ATP-dependent protease